MLIQIKRNCVTSLVNSRLKTVSYIMTSSAARALHHFQWDYPKNVIRMTVIEQVHDAMFSKKKRTSGLSFLS